LVFTHIFVNSSDTHIRKQSKTHTEELYQGLNQGFGYMKKLYLWLVEPRGTTQAWTSRRWTTTAEWRGAECNGGGVDWVRPPQPLQLTKMFCCMPASTVPAACRGRGRRLDLSCRPLPLHRGRGSASTRRVEGGSVARRRRDPTVLLLGGDEIRRWC
jgi:hypothetical protein